MSATTSFEGLREESASLRPARSNDEREIIWVSSSHGLGVSRAPSGSLEIFVVGPRLVTGDRVIADNLDFDVWRSATGQPVTANRLLLPAASHFDGVAALLCTELVNAGVLADPEAAFRRCEPVIALALTAQGPSDQVLVGLVGEVVVLDALTREHAHPAAVLSSWYGWGPSTRDFQLGGTGVEVKTTTGSASRHHVQGLHQVELGTSVAGVPEDHLYLLSVGIEWQPDGAGGRTLPDLIDAVLARLDGEAGGQFLDRLRQYGGDVAHGYDHYRHRRQERFSQPFQVVFERLYDLTDDLMKLLRESDVAGAAHVPAGSISFEVALPRRIRGDVNPVAGMAAITAVLRGALGGPG